ncbi:MAG: hypothetical protein JWM87_251 [Candidatus Eremiobacteraeota bacterium]|nr:hypothetical protein [Candidatus Eremiobacteraeota bacterium]
MRDLFGALAARALGVAPDIAPRVPSRFESVESAAPAGDGAVLSAFDDPPASQAHGAGRAVDVGSASRAADASGLASDVPDDAVPAAQPFATSQAGDLAPRSSTFGARYEHDAASAREPHVARASDNVLDRLGAHDGNDVRNASDASAVNDARSTSDADYLSGAHGASDVYAASDARDVSKSSVGRDPRDASEARGASDVADIDAVRVTTARNADAGAVPRAPIERVETVAERAPQPRGRAAAAMPAERDASTTSETPVSTDRTGSPRRAIVPRHSETPPDSGDPHESPVHELRDDGDAADGISTRRPSQAPEPRTARARRAEFGTPDDRIENVPLWSVRPESDALSTRARRDDVVQPLAEPDPATVHVHIARVDVRMLPAPAAPQRPRRNAPEPALKLDEYLRNRGRPAR